MGFEQLLQDVAFACARFLAFSAHAFLFGAPVVILVVLRPVFARLDQDAWAAGRDRLAARLDGVVQAAFVASAIATAVTIALQAVLHAQLQEGDISRPTFLSVFSTTFGQWHLFRFPLLAGLLVLLSGKVRQWALKPRGGAAPAWWVGWLGLALALLATHSFTGHAAVSSPRALGLLNDIVHLSFASIWFAGIVTLAILLPDAWAGRTDRDRLSLLGPVVSRFSKVALVSIAIVAITGTINSLLNVATLGDMLSSTYGATLSVKIAFFLGIIALGGVNHFILRDRIQKGTDDPRAGAAQRTFRTTIAIELVIALTIMGVTGWLTGQARTRQHQLPPAAPVSSGSTP
jgi:putative copper export protein